MPFVPWSTSPPSEGGGLCQVKGIAVAEALPAPTLAGILKNLARGGLVQSRKGPRGGFALRRSADQITLYQIMESLGQTDTLSQCVVGLGTCSDDTPCPVHDRIQAFRQRLVECLQAITIADMQWLPRRKKDKHGLISAARQPG